MQPEQKVNVLLVDDHPENLLALEAILGTLGQNLVKAHSGTEALRCLLHQDFAVILLDVQMPGIDGFETAELIRERDRSRHTPIIFLTAFSTSDTLVFRGYSLGAVDYLFKPIEPEILKSKVAVFVDLFKKTAEVKRQTAQLRAVNAELSESEQRFRSLSACSPLGIFLTDVEGRCTYINPSGQAICGLSNEEGLALGWLQSVHPDDRDWVLTEWSTVIYAGQEYSSEFRFLVKAKSRDNQLEQPGNSAENTAPLNEGVVRWVHVRSSPLSDQGKLMGHVGTVEDITERKQAEEARTQFIREQAARQEAEAANRMKDEFLATLSHELRTPLNSMLGWARLLRTREFDQKTKIRALETIERNAKLQAELIDDILDVSRIIRGKLRLNICTINLVFVIEAALDAVRPAAEAKDINLELLINQRELETTGAAQVITGEPLQTLTAPGVATHPTKIQSPKFLVAGDPDRLQQIVWNLLSNAIKFTPEGGKVELRLSAVHSPQESQVPISQTLAGLQVEKLETQSVNSPQPLISPQATDSYAQLEISDTGVGINKDFLPFVFDRFRQADGTTTRAHGGLGLGLAIVRHLVELHGGRVQVDSEGEGQGSTFTVRLPLQSDVEAKGGDTELDRSSESILRAESPPDTQNCGCPTQTHPLESPTLSSALEGLRVLVVDDEPDARDLLTVLLQEQGATVIAAGSTSEAFQAIQQLQLDILISDIGMPYEDGHSLIRQVRNLSQEQGGKIPAIALTAYVREQDFQNALSAGYQVHMPKPVNTAELIKTVATLTGRTGTD